MKGMSIDDVTFLVQYGGNNDIILYKFNAYFEPRVFGIGCNCYKPTLYSDKIPQITSALIISNAFIVSNSQYYIGGNNPWDFYQLETSNINFDMAFIYSSQASENSLKLQVTVVGQPISNSDGRSSVSIASQTSTGSTLTATVTDNYLLTQPQVFSTPTLDNPPINKIVLNPPNPQIVIYWFPYDNVARTIPAGAQPSGCSGLCTSELVAPPDPAGFTLTLDKTALTLKVYFTDPTLITTSIVLTSVGVPYNLYYSNLQYVINSHPITLLAPVIDQTAVLPIPDFTYYLNDVAKTSTAIPLSVYKSSVASIDPILATDTRLDIKYELIEVKTGVKPSWITGYDSVTRFAIIKSGIDALEADYPMQVTAWFDYAPAPTLVTGQTFKILLRDKCRQPAIVSPSPPILYYQVGEGPLPVALPEWTHAYSIIAGACGDFDFVITANLLGIPMTLTQAKNVPTLTFNSIFDGDHMSYTTSATTDITQLTGTLYKTNPGDPFGSATINLFIRIISPRYTYLALPTIESITYVVTQPAFVTDSIVISITDTETLPLYINLVTTGGLNIDSTIIKLDTISNPSSITVQTTDNAKIGVYLMKLSAKFDIRTPYIVYSNEFSITVLHQCTRNVISGQNIDDRQYNVSNTQILIGIEQFKYTERTCGPMTYKATLVGGAPLPPFIRFSVMPLGFGIYSMSFGAVGKYQIELKATTPYYSGDSDNIKQFSVDVKCFSKKVKPKVEVINVQFVIGTLDVESVLFPEFEVWPMCDPATQIIEYSAKLLTGEPLPTYVKLYEQERTITIFDDGTLVEGEIIIQVSARALDSFIRQSLSLHLKIYPAGTILNLAAQNFTKLAPVQISVRPDESASYVSTAFSNYTKSTYTLIKTDVNLKFIQMQGQTISIIPTVKNIGTHTVQLYALSESGEKLVQIISIKVGFEKGSRDFGKYIEVAAQIIKISKSGIVQIRFNQQMEVPANINQINNQTLLLKYKTNLQTIGVNKNFTWEAESFKPGNLLTLYIYFEDPFSISTDGIDTLQIMVLDKTLFSAKSGIEIVSRYKMEKIIPKQMDNSAASRYIDALALNIQDNLDEISTNSIIFNIIFGFTMSRLWGLIASMQIIVLMPLISVDIPANVQLVYFFIQSNMNFQIIPIDTKAYGIFEFDPNKDRPHTSSKYMLENINENFMNFVAVLFVIVFVKMAELVALHWNKKFNLIELLKSILIYNFLLMVLLENSLQFIIFSVINLLEYSTSFDSPSEKFSYLLSGLILIMLVYILYLNLSLVVITKDPVNIKERNPKYSSLFELLKTTSNEALVYQTIFLMRRVFLAIILIFWEESKVGQIMGMMIVSLVQMAYFIAVRPFEDKALNYIEMFNEVMILTCLYHMLFFTGGITDDVFIIYKIGWSMDIILMSLFTVNIVSLGYQGSKKIIALVNAFYKRMKLKRTKSIQAKKIQQLIEMGVLKQYQADTDVTNMMSPPRVNRGLSQQFGGLIPDGLNINGSAANVINRIGRLDKNGMFQDDEEFRFEDFLPVQLKVPSFTATSDTNSILNMQGEVSKFEQSIAIKGNALHQLISSSKFINYDNGANTRKVSDVQSPIRPRTPIQF